MITRDQMNRIVELKQFPPQKIISLVPSITELLSYLNLENELIGITKFCIYPTYIFKSKERIGGTKNLDIEKIKKLNPDLIIGNKEENVKEQIEELSSLFPVWMSDVNTYLDALDMIKQVGVITDRRKEAEILIQEIQENFHQIEKTEHLIRNKSVLYLIWHQPYIAVGNNTYIHDILHKIGAINALSNKNRYVEITVHDIQQLNPDFILLSSEPFPFKEKHQQELEQILPTAKTILVNGEVFSWYGPKMKYLLEHLLCLSSM